MTCVACGVAGSATIFHMAVRFRRGLGKEQVSVACAVAGSATMLTGHRSIRGLEPQVANPVHVGKKKSQPTVVRPAPALTRALP